MSDERQRELIVEEVAEAEALLSDPNWTLTLTDDTLAAMNDRLAHLQTQATSLGMPTTKIFELKSRVCGALGRSPGPRPKRSNLDNPGPRGKEKVYPVEPPKDRTKAVEDLFKFRGGSVQMTDSHTSFIFDGVELSTVRKISDYAESIAASGSEALARRFLSEYASHIALVGDDAGRLDPHGIAERNIGYLSGYFGGEQGRRIREVFGVTHPVFGDTEPTPEEAFELGARWMAGEAP